MHFTIKNVANLVGLTPRTLRYYESLGLLPEPGRTAGNYRVYTAADVVDLLRIKRLTGLGFTLENVFHVIDDPAGDQALASLEQLGVELDAQIAELVEKRRAVSQLVEARAPLDVAFEIAEAVTHLEQAYPDLASHEIDRMRYELVMALGSEQDTERMQQLLQDMVVNRDDPAYVRLHELDTRFESLGPESSEQEIDELIAGYTEGLFAVYSRLADALPSEQLQTLTQSLNEGVYNDQQLRVMTLAMAAVKERFKALE